MEELSWPRFLLWPYGRIAKDAGRLTGGENVFLTEFIALLVLLSFVFLIGSRIGKKYRDREEFIKVDMDDEEV